MSIVDDVCGQKSSVDRCDFAMQKQKWHHRRSSSRLTEGPSSSLHYFQRPRGGLNSSSSRYFLPWLRLYYYLVGRRLVFAFGSRHLSMGDRMGVSWAHILNERGRQFRSVGGHLPMGAKNNFDNLAYKSWWCGTVCVFWKKREWGGIPPK